VFELLQAGEAPESPEAEELDGIVNNLL